MTAANNRVDVRQLLTPYSGQWESEARVGDELESMDVVRYRLTLYPGPAPEELRGQMWLIREAAGSGMRRMVRLTNLPRPRYAAAVKCVKRGAAGAYSCVLELDRQECGGADCHLTCPELTVEDGHLTSSNGDSACHFRRTFLY